MPKQMHRRHLLPCFIWKLKWTQSVDSKWTVSEDCINLRCTHMVTHTEEKGRLIEVWESNTDGMRRKKLEEKMNQKLWVIVPAQCTQLSIVQVPRASAITAQLMPVVWLRLQLRITALDPVQKEEKKKKKGRRAGNWIPAASEKRTRVRVANCRKV